MKCLPASMDAIKHIKNINGVYQINNSVDVKYAYLAFVYFLEKYFKIAMWLFYKCLGISIICGLLLKKQK